MPNRRRYSAVQHFKIGVLPGARRQVLAPTGRKR
jgi:hypothetical protein